MRAAGWLVLDLDNNTIDTPFHQTDMSPSCPILSYPIPSHPKPTHRIPSHPSHPTYHSRLPHFAADPETRYRTVPATEHWMPNPHRISTLQLFR
ncbi:hypothetical protein BV22DRAFT_841371 [Leucogyrophana mollusca]|uniref:Uncharacterized protein n=1 Tax=Leucogyrophana mollusca TaxID=85980 RepID=A0ACB8B369_9AGAM|nr:hypothetical protein BV22DRAFT_841371 [Leucogyrophana mollusca]